MLKALRKLGGQSLIYGVPGISSRFIGFLLIPVYTRLLTPPDYGIMAVVGTFAQFLGIGYFLGLKGAVTRYYHDFDTEERKRFYGTIWTFLNLFVWPVSLAIFFYAQPLCHVLFQAPQYAQYLRVAVLGTACTIASIIPSTVFLMREQVWTVLWTGMLGCVVGAAAPLYCVVVLKMGVMGVFVGTFVAQAFSFVFLQYFILPEVRFGIDLSYLRTALAFGLPLVPHLGASWALNYADRYLLQQLSSEAELGLYSLGYNFGFIMMFVTGSINTAWVPYFYRINSEDPQDAPSQVAGIFTYYAVFICLIAYCIGAFSKEVIELMAGERFHSAYHVVPWIAATYVLQGFYFMSVNGLFLRKRTKILPFITGTGALTNIVLNILWIPQHGMMGAAWATLVSYVVLFGLIFTASQRCYPVPWEYGRVAKVLLAFGLAWAIVGLWGWGDTVGLQHALSVKVGALLAIPAVLFLTRFLTADEIRALRRRLR